MTNQPKLTIAPPQRGDEPGTWAYRTVSTRFANTAQRILIENRFSKSIKKRIKALIADIPDAPIRSIDDPQAPDMDAWKGYVEPYLGLNWHQPPWFFTEHYFYRRILEATRYFRTGDGSSVDPFGYQKRKGLELSRNSIHPLMERVNSWLKDGSHRSEEIENLMYLDLWGNQADLSLWPAEGGEKPDHADLQKALNHILVNDAGIVSENLLQAKPLERVDFLVDNAGFELVSDLAFADLLLSSGIVIAVRLHVKLHPTYVSDAMEKDVRASIEFLRSDRHTPTRETGERLREALKSDKLQITGNWFWTSPLDGWLMPPDLHEELSEANLVISKGDANYRRLLGDRHWEYTAEFEDILSYFPTTLTALRTLKSELIVGLRDGQAQEISANDPDWLINGRWGIIQNYKESTGF